MMNNPTHLGEKIDEEHNGTLRKVKKRHPDETKRLERLAEQLDRTRTYGYQVGDKTHFIKAISSKDATDLGRRVAYKDTASFKSDPHYVK